MKVYLIDFENVKSKGLTGIDSLTEYDRVIIFYSENADTINFEMHQKVLISKAEIEYFKVHVGGKNALDFQLSTLLGYLVSKNYYSHIFVISNDKSFDFLHDFWHGKYIAAPECVVYRTKTIAQAINYVGGKKQTVVEEEPDTVIFAAASDEQKTAEEATAQPVEETAAEVPAETAEIPVEEAPAEKEEAPAEQPKTARVAKTSKPKKSEPKDEEFTISEEELDALEASFSAYSIVRFDEPEKAPEKTEKKPAPAAVKTEVVKAEEKPEPVKEAPAEKAQKPAPAEEAPVESKPRQKQVKGFFASLKDALKKAECTPEVINHISQLLINSDTKEEFHNALAKDYKQEATELYKLLRPKYLRLKEMYAAEHPEYVSPDTVIEVQPEEPVKTEKKAEAPVEKKPEEKAETTEEKAPDAVKAEEKPAKAKRSAKSKKTSEDKAAKPKRTRKTAEKPAEPDRLAELLDGKSSSEELELIRQLFREAATKQQLYIKMIKMFGKNRGCVFYNAIKAEYASLSEVIK